MITNLGPIHVDKAATTKANATVLVVSSKILNSLLSLSALKRTSKAAVRIVNTVESVMLVAEEAVLEKSSDYCAISARSNASVI